MLLRFHDGPSLAGVGARSPIVKRLLAFSMDRPTAAPLIGWSFEVTAVLRAGIVDVADITRNRPGEFVDLRYGQRKHG